MNKICQFCNKEFTTLSNLRAHIKSSKTCISLRPNINKEQLSIIKCEFCSKEFSKKGNLTPHLKTCKIKKTIDINDNSLEMNNLKQELKKIKDNYINLNKDYDNLKELLSEMNIELRIKYEQIKMKDEVINILKIKNELL